MTGGPTAGGLRGRQRWGEAQDPGPHLAHSGREGREAVGCRALGMSHGPTLPDLTPSRTKSHPVLAEAVVRPRRLGQCQLVHQWHWAPGHRLEQPVGKLPAAGAHAARGGGGAARSGSMKTTQSARCAHVRAEAHGHTAGKPRMGDRGAEGGWQRVCFQAAPLLSLAGPRGEVTPAQVTARMPTPHSSGVLAPSPGAAAEPRHLRTKSCHPRGDPVRQELV